MTGKSLHHVTELKVRFNECDPLQIVWHGNYFKYLEDAREEFCNKNSLGYLQMQERGISTPVIKVSCDYKLPLKYGDVFTVETIFVPTPAAKMIFRYKGFLEDKIVFTAETVQVFLNEKGELLLNNPSFFIDWKKKMGLAP